MKLSYLLLFFTLILIVFTWVSSYTLVSDQLFFEFYGNQLTYERIMDLIDEQKKWEWLGYVLVPLFYLIKFFLISCVILMGIFILGLKTRFIEIFKVVVIAEFIFFIPILMKFIWFGFIHRDYDLMELMNFAPLSLDNILDSSGAPWLTPTLKSLNLFELCYWLLLSYGLMRVINRSFDQSLGLVMASYGSAFVVWQVFLIFLSINLAA